MTLTPMKPFVSGKTPAPRSTRQDIFQTTYRGIWRRTMTTIFILEQQTTSNTEALPTSRKNLDESIFKTTIETRNRNRNIRISILPQHWQPRWTRTRTHWYQWNHSSLWNRTWNRNSITWSRTRTDYSNGKHYNGTTSYGSGSQRKELPQETRTV